MVKDSTLNHLVRFLYRETSALESLDILEALDSSYPMQEAHDELEVAFQQLPKVKFNPKKSSIQAILRYSKRTTVGAS